MSLGGSGVALCTLMDESPLIHMGLVEEECTSDMCKLKENIR